MKINSFIFVSGLIAATSMNAFAQNPAPNNAVDRIIPVLVTFDSSGKAAEVFPAPYLDAKLGEVVKKNMKLQVKKNTSQINKIKTNQFLVGVRLSAMPASHGSYDVGIGYVSSKPLPRGNWRWVTKLDGRLLLVDQNGRESKGIVDKYHLPGLSRSFNDVSLRGPTPLR